MEAAAARAAAAEADLQGLQGQLEGVRASHAAAAEEAAMLRANLDKVGGGERGRGRGGGVLGFQRGAWDVRQC